MTRKTYASPAAFRVATDQRLRRRALEQGRDLHRERQLFIFDRLLHRVVDVVGDNAILKGGFLLEIMLDDARTTKDIDFGLRGSPDRLIEQFKRVGALVFADFLTFEITPDRRHHELAGPGMVYHGRRFKAQARLAGKPFGDPFGIDVAFADPIHGEPQIRRGGEFLASYCEGAEAFSYQAYPLASQIAEKLHAYAMPRQRENSRVRDLPDIALLASIRTLSAPELRKALELTFSHRATHAIPRGVPDPPTSWSPVYARLAKDNALRWSQLAELLRAVRLFLDPVLGPRVANGRWNPDLWDWTVADGSV